MSDETSPLAPAGPSPLAEADPASVNLLIQDRIDRVMNLKPSLISDEELRVAINYHRANRARFIIESQQKAPRAKPGARKAPQSIAEALASATASMDLL